MQRTKGRVQYASTSSKCKVLIDDFQNEENGWSCCSEESGFADSEYRKVTKRRRGTRMVHISRNVHSTTDEETTRSSSRDGHQDIADACAFDIAESDQDAIEGSTSDSEDDMYWEIRLMNAESEKDPLALYCSYIAKLEEDEQSSEKVNSILRQCTVLYTQDERYMNDERLVQIWLRYISTCIDKLDKFRYLETNKLCTCSALFWLEFSSHHGDELCGLLDAYATLKRGLEFYASNNFGASASDALNQSLQLAIAANKMKDKITEKLAKENLLLFNDEKMPSKNEMDEGSADEIGMTATGELCEFMCNAFKNATLDVASNFLLRWIRKSHQMMTEKHLQHCQRLNFIEQDRDMKLKIAELSKQQLMIDFQTKSDESGKRVATEIEELKASASDNFECIQQLFLATFEKLCDNEQELLGQKKMIARERKLQVEQTTKRNDEIAAFAVRSKKEILYVRSTLEWMMNAVAGYRKETEHEINQIRLSIFRVIEDRQREHDANLMRSASQFATSFALKVKELEVLAGNIEEKEACIMSLSSQLASEQSDLRVARRKHDDDSLQIAEITQSNILEKQQRQTLTDRVDFLQHENTTLQQALNEQLGNSARLHREASVMQENFRRLERKIDGLQILNEERQSDVKRLQDDLNKELDFQLRLKSEIDQQKIETESIRLSRDKLKIELASKELQFEKLQKQMADIKACFGKV